MGIDKFRFIGSGSRYFTCPVCEDVAEDPVMSPCCLVIFCRECYFISITDSFKDKNRCQECQKDVLDLAIDSFRGTLRKIYFELTMRCKSKSCAAKLTVENYEIHDKVCAFVGTSRSKEPVDTNCNCSPEFDDLIKRLDRIESNLGKMTEVTEFQENQEPGNTNKLFIYLFGAFISLYSVVVLLSIVFNVYDDDYTDNVPPQ